MYIKYDAVMCSIGQLGDITKADAYFLVGKKSGYDQLHVSHHTMDLRVVAIQIETLVKSFPSEKRRQAIAKAFTYLSGYNSYSDAYSNHRENRKFTSKGVVILDDPLFSSDKDGDYEKDEEVLSNLKFC